MNVSLSLLVDLLPNAIEQSLVPQFQRLFLKFLLLPLFPLGLSLVKFQIELGEGPVFLYSKLFNVHPEIEEHV